VTESLLSGEDQMGWGRAPGLRMVIWATWGEAWKSDAAGLRQLQPKTREGWLIQEMAGEFSSSRVLHKRFSASIVTRQVSHLSSLARGGSPDPDG
jgi:hypothetical protein